jgi:hypothetical protein
MGGALVKFLTNVSFLPYVIIERFHFEERKKKPTMLLRSAPNSAGTQHGAGYSRSVSPQPYAYTSNSMNAHPDHTHHHHQPHHATHPSSPPSSSNIMMGLVSAPTTRPSTAINTVVRMISSSGTTTYDPVSRPATARMMLAAAGATTLPNTTTSPTATQITTHAPAWHANHLSKTPSEDAMIQRVAMYAASLESRTRDLAVNLSPGTALSAAVTGEGLWSDLAYELSYTGAPSGDELNDDPDPQNPFPVDEMGRDDSGGGGFSMVGTSTISQANVNHQQQQQQQRQSQGSLNRKKSMEFNNSTIDQDAVMTKQEPSTRKSLTTSKRNSNASMIISNSTNQPPEQPPTASSSHRNSVKIQRNSESSRKYDQMNPSRQNSLWSSSQNPESTTTTQQQQQQHTSTNNLDIALDLVPPQNMASRVSFSIPHERNPSLNSAPQDQNQQQQQPHQRRPSSSSSSATSHSRRSSSSQNPFQNAALQTTTGNNSNNNNNNNTQNSPPPAGNNSNHPKHQSLKERLKNVKPKVPTRPPKKTSDFPGPDKREKQLEFEVYLVTRWHASTTLFPQKQRHR